MQGESYSMSQTLKGQKDSTPQKSRRPGQRQQERLVRLARRRRRSQIWTSIIVTLVVIALASVTYWQYQLYSARVAADRAAKATATAVAAAAATATSIRQSCFIAPAGTKTDNIYSATATPSAGPTTSPRITGTPVTLKDGLKYIDITVGKGPAAKKGSAVSVEYTLWLQDGCKKIDSSYDRKGQPFTLTLGKGQVIKGFDEGLIGMKKGGTRRLLIPPALAYGAQAQGQIPANSTLIFDVTVVSVK